MSQLLELRGEIISIDRLNEASSKWVLVIKTSESNKWALYEREVDGYKRVKRISQFIFIDEKSNRIAIVEGENIVITHFLRGPRGKKGSTGRRGKRGISGSPGVSGAPGQSISGAPGQSISGSPGSEGVSGSPGSEGVSGSPGQGISGTPGSEGVSGSPGSEGVSGSPGSEGVSGSPGSEGVSGSPGPEGVSGAPGSSSISSAFGSAYSAGISSQTLLPGIFLPGMSGELYVTFTSSVNGGITLNGTNDALIIPSTGNYQADYTVLLVTTGSYQSIKLINTRSAIPFVIPNSAFFSKDNQIDGAVQFAAQAGDQISISNNSLSTSVTLDTIPIEPITFAAHVASTTTSNSIMLGLPGIATDNSSNSVYVAIGYGISTSVLSVTDSLGNTYSEAISNTEAGTVVSSIYYFDNVTPGLAFSITILFDNATFGKTAQAALYLNTATPSIQSTTLNGATVPPTISPFISLSYSPTAVGQVLFMGVNMSQNVTYSNGTLTIIDSTTGPNASVGADAYKFVTVTGTQSGTVNANPVPLTNIWSATGIVIGVGSASPFEVIPNNASLVIQSI